MRKVCTVFAALTLLFAACGDDDSDVASTGGDTGSESESGSGGEASGEPPVALEGTVNDHGIETAGDSLEMELDDFYFGPTFVQTDPGATITLTLTNEGEAPHTFTIDALDVDEELQPGDTAEVEVTLPDEGATLLYCKFHQSQGMQGAFFFEEGDELNASGTSQGGQYGG